MEEIPRSSSDDDESFADSKSILRSGVVETSPGKRYMRYDVLLSKLDVTSSQSSYKAFDTKNGIEVIWNIINLSTSDDISRQYVMECTQIVKNIENSCLNEYLDCWFEEKTGNLNIITSLYTTLEEFLDKVITLRWKIVKKWCKYLLRGLDALHSSSPSVIHRHISCSRIFIDSGLGTLKLGMLWLGGLMEDGHCKAGLPYEGSLVYSAPEVLSNEYFSSKVCHLSFFIMTMVMIQSCSLVFCFL